MAAVGKGWEVLVDVGLEGMHQPLHGLLSPALYPAQLGVTKAVGRILPQTSAVRRMVALHGGDNQLCAGAFQILLHAPALAIGGVRVIKHIVTVKHIEYGITQAFVLLKGVRNIDVSPAAALPGKLRYGQFPLIHHDETVTPLSIFFVV